MKIEVGKRYQLRDGNFERIVNRINAIGKLPYLGESGRGYYEDGGCFIYGKDIIHEAPELDEPKLTKPLPTANQDSSDPSLMDDLTEVPERFGIPPLPFPVVKYVPSFQGKTLRDEFAMAALPAMFVGSSVIDFESLASDAYSIADAMLEARKVDKN